MNFISDQLLDGRRFRPLSVVSSYNRRCPDIHPDKSIKGEGMVSLMDHLAQVTKAVPERIQVDNESKNISKALDKWLYDNKVKPDFSRPEKPTDTPYFESFNGRVHNECLNVNWFLSLEDVRGKMEARRLDYNQYILHSSIAFEAPDEVHKIKSLKS